MAYHQLGAGRLLRGKGLFGWQPLHETEFHWRDAPCCAEVDNVTSPSVALDGLLALLPHNGVGPLPPRSAPWLSRIDRGQWIPKDS